MGEVHQERLIRIEERTACDDRCQLASGPSCNCQCQGKNHGAKVTVTVVVDVGGIPRVTPPNPEKAVRIHAEWLRAKDGVEARIAKHFPGYQRYRNSTPGLSLSKWEENQNARAQAYLQKVALAGRLKTHHGRLKAVEDIHSKLTEAAR